eukprot:scaffold13789_cov143-Skeletonema_dohrnii-CCMP3373.AAC.1
MADGDDNIFIYMGGEHEVPRNVRRVIIDRSVNIIPARAFYQREELVSVKMHEDVEIIGRWAFSRCTSIRRLKLPGVKEVRYMAFYDCGALTNVEFGDKLETIGSNAFFRCHIKSIKAPSVRTIEERAFGSCTQLTNVELPDVERICREAFIRCPALRRIAIPLKDDIFHRLEDYHYHRYTHFDYCRNLTTVDVVGEIDKIISSLLLDCWRDQVNQEINRINQVLPNTPAYEKTGEIQQWIRSVLRRMVHFRNEHRVLLKEATTLLELALWKAKLDEKEDCSIEGRAKKATKFDTAGTRNERRITSGANIVIRNVLPFLQLDE